MVAEAHEKIPYKKREENFIVKNLRGHFNTNRKKFIYIKLAFSWDCEAERN